ncbi:hypothetical protein [Streptomyces sp. NK08204]|uniref:hypothetical protein n=1 Tax=Streptomyces sp. NK08204 TaxID=2873260 RepID=UPI001CEC9C91|nr:hypothetical protein [Streptomyces sp. NK08204]
MVAVLAAFAGNFDPEGFMGRASLVRACRMDALCNRFDTFSDLPVRPEEAVALPDCRLPRSGWRQLILYRTRSQAGKRWTDSGEYHDERGLKNRPPGEARAVPLPPHLVAMRRGHVTAFGAADDGRLLFQAGPGHQLHHLSPGLARDPGVRPVSRSHEAFAREAAVRSAALGTRHSALSAWLCAGAGAGAGADPAEVAERAGCSVEVLLSRYAKCLYDPQSVNNQRIEELLSSCDQPPEPDGE